MTKVVLTRRAPRSYRGLILAIGLLVALGGMTALTVFVARDGQRRAQMQTDSRVAAVWVLGVARGAQPLTRGSLLQKWLNARGIHAFGEYRVLTSRYNNGNRDSLEIWFDYQSYLKQYPQLECHRIGQTAFVDDLGQRYHGFLDFQDQYVGVYLPGYDHAARRLVCAVRWMPRQPARPRPMSKPMVFTVDLPPAKRVLPPADTLPRRFVTVTNQGVTATVGQARLSEPDYRIGGYAGSQRELTFRLKIEGGELVGSNVSRPYQLISNTNSNLRLYFRQRALAGTTANDAASQGRAFTITDPYGVSLLPEDELLSPMLTPDEAKPMQGKEGTVYTAPVNGAGQGTDAVRLRFDVRPKGSAPSAPTIPFDITIPVQTGGEI
ncbi:MAG TPA: hypothetical protein VFB21_16350 [Chthonomonadaceae bacterium]|nr:hypothetical protein [Chthonomonadaceae bacterium]